MVIEQSVCVCVGVFALVRMCVFMWLLFIKIAANEEMIYFYEKIVDGDNLSLFYHEHVVIKIAYV